MIYPDGLTRGVQILLAVALVTGNLLVYGLWARRRLQARQARAAVGL